MMDVTPDIAESLGLAGAKGAWIAWVIPQGPAATAGLIQGDLITRANGVGIGTGPEFLGLVSKGRPGEVVHVDFIRNGVAGAIDVPLGVRPAVSPTAVALPLIDARETASASALGLGLRALDEPMRRRHKFRDLFNGVMVASVADGSDSFKNGVHAGDVIISANLAPVSTPADIQAAVAQGQAAGHANVLLFIYRAGQHYPVPVKIAN